MLNIFPDLLTYGLVAPFILRIALGILFVNLGRLELTREQKRWRNIFEVIHLKPAAIWAMAFGVVEILVGILLIAGLFTQVVALVVAIISLAEIIIEKREPLILKHNIVFYLFIFVISISLLFTGAGFLAFDWPL